MNPYSGDIQIFKSRAEVPRGWLELTDEEAQEYLTLPLDIRIKRYIQTHSKDKCKSCGCWLANHNPRKFKECAANELANFDIEKLEAQLAAKQPSMPDVSHLYEQLPRQVYDYAETMALRETLQQKREEYELALSGSAE
jgi:hypothetical protein